MDSRIVPQIDNAEYPGGVPMTQNAPSCFVCGRYTGNRRCEAFTDADIPDVIWNGTNTHETPVDGDGGIVYQSGMPRYMSERK